MNTENQVAGNVHDAATMGEAARAVANARPDQSWLDAAFNAGKQQFEASREQLERTWDGLVERYGVKEPATAPGIPAKSEVLPAVDEPCLADPSAALPSVPAADPTLASAPGSALEWLVTPEMAIIAGSAVAGLVVVRAVDNITQQPRTRTIVDQAR